MNEPDFPAALANRFEPVRLLGRGGFGSVWLAEQKALRRSVAIKTLNVELAASDDQRTRFLDEARLTASLHHPGVITLLDHGVEGGMPWMAFEYVEGESLRRAIERGPLPWRTVAEVGRQVALALEEAREHGVVHRDVKPDNILCSADGRYLIGDFGIAKWAGNCTQTSDGTILGTPAYVSPQQIRGHVPAHQSDLYALGVTLFELAAGRLPFVDESPYRMLEKHLKEPPPVLSELVPDVPSGLSDIVAKLLLKERPPRFTTSAELADELARLLSRGEPKAPLRSRSFATGATARPSTSRLRAVTGAVRPGTQVPRGAAPRRGIALAAAGALALFALLGVWRGRSPAPAAPAPSPSPTAAVSGATAVDEEAASLAQALQRLDEQLNQVAAVTPSEGDLLRISERSRPTGTIVSLGRVAAEFPPLVRRLNAYRGPQAARLLAGGPVLARLVELSGRDLRTAALLRFANTPEAAAPAAELRAVLVRLRAELGAPPADPLLLELSQANLPSLEEVCSPQSVENNSTQRRAAKRAADTLDTLSRLRPDARGVEALTEEVRLLARACSIDRTGWELRRTLRSAPERATAEEQEALGMLMGVVKAYLAVPAAQRLRRDHVVTEVLMFCGCAALAADRGSPHGARVAAAQLAFDVARGFTSGMGAPSLASSWSPALDALRPACRELGVPVDTAALAVLDQAR